MDEKQCDTCEHRCESDGILRPKPHCKVTRGRPQISKIVLPAGGCDKYKPKEVK